MPTHGQHDVTIPLGISPHAALLPKPVSPGSFWNSTELRDIAGPLAMLVLTSRAKPRSLQASAQSEIAGT